MNKKRRLRTIFIGQSYLNTISKDQIFIGNVTFEPGCRNNWHIHHAKSAGGQILIVTAGRDALEEFAPEFAHYNDDVLFGENWNNEDINVKTRCIITVVALMAQGITDNSIKFHIMNAKKNGVTQKEMVAIITHVAFYAGWPKAWAVFNIAKEVYNEK